MTQKAEAISRPDAPPRKRTVGVEKKRRKDQQRPWFDRECLELKRLMNLARRANVTAWPLPSPWNVRFQMLKDAIKTERLKAVPDRHGREKWTLVCLCDVQMFVNEYGAGDKWAWLRDICRTWAKEGGHILPSPNAAKVSTGATMLAETLLPALPSKVFSQAKVTKWYKERVADWKAGDPIPTLDDDVAAANDKFRDKVTQRFVRGLRNKFAPPAWNVHKRGPKSNPPKN